MQRNRNERDGTLDAERSPAPGACASCKHRRKKCGRGCVLAPFFPGAGDEGPCFREVHKIFGVGNVQKLIRRLKEEKKATKVQLEEAVDAVKWVARSWEQDPLRGCRGEYKRLEETYLRLRCIVTQCRFCNQSSKDQAEEADEEAGLHRLQYRPIQYRHQILLPPSYDGHKSNGDNDAMVFDCHLNGGDGILNVHRQAPTVSGAPVCNVPAGILEAQIGFRPGFHLPPLAKQLMITSTQFGFTVSNGLHATNNHRRLQGNPSLTHTHIYVYIQYTHVDFLPPKVPEIAELIQ